MGFEYLTNVPLEQARKDYIQLLESHGFGSKTEVIPVFSACGRVTAQAVYAHICAPHYAASAMDGVAVNAKVCGSPTILTTARRLKRQTIPKKTERIGIRHCSGFHSRIDSRQMRYYNLMRRSVKTEKRKIV